MNTAETLIYEKELKQAIAFENYKKLHGLDKPREFHEENRRVQKVSAKFHKRLDKMKIVGTVGFLLLVRCLINLSQNGSFELWVDLTNKGW